MEPKNKMGPKPKADRQERRVTRSVSLNDYEYNALVALAAKAEANSVGAYLVKKLKLPSAAVAAAKFQKRHAL